MEDRRLTFPRLTLKEPQLTQTMSEGMDVIREPYITSNKKSKQTCR